MSTNNFCFSFICLFFLVFTGCHENEQINNGKIDVNVQKKQNIKASTIFQEIKWVRLDTSRDAFLGKIDKIKFGKDKIYILDNQHTKSIKIFSLKGKYLFTLKTTFEDSDKRIKINDFEIDDTTGQILVLEGISQKIYYFSQKGDFQNEIKLKFYAHKFMKIGNYFYFFKNKQANNGEDKLNFFDVLVSDNSGNIVQKYRPFAIPEGEFIRFASAESFSKFQNEGIYNEFLNDTIFNLQKDKLIAKYNINFVNANLNEKEKRLPPDHLKKVLLDNQKKIAFGTTYFIENQNLICFQYIYNLMPYFFYYNKNSSTKYCIRILEDDFNNTYLSYPITAYKDNLVGVLDEQQVEKIGISDKNNQANYQKMYGEVVEKGYTYIYFAKPK